MVRLLRLVPDYATLFTLGLPDSPKVLGDKLKNMENKLLHTIEFDKSTMEVKYDDNYLKIKTNEREITITDEHESDCCEHVWADFEILKHYMPRLEGRFKKIEIKGVSEMGLLLVFYPDYGVEEKVFIPCYNEQNGYYSTDLRLVIMDGQTKTEIDIRDCEQDLSY